MTGQRKKAVLFCRQLLAFLPTGLPPENRVWPRKLTSGCLALRAAGSPPRTGAACSRRAEERPRRRRLPGSACAALTGIRSMSSCAVTDIRLPTPRTDPGVLRPAARQALPGGGASGARQVPMVPARGGQRSRQHQLRRWARRNPPLGGSAYQATAGSGPPHAQDRGR